MNYAVAAWARVSHSLFFVLLYSIGCPLRGASHVREMREQSGLPYTLRYINERAPFIDFNDNQIETKQNKRLPSACWKRNINYSRPITANDS